MQVRYGGYWFPENAVAVSTTRDTIDDDRGYPVTERHTFSVRGTLFGANQTEITAVCVALENALRLQGRDLLVYQDDGQVAFGLRNVATLNGVRVKGPDYPEGEGGEYTTYRTFTATFTGDVPLRIQAGAGGSLLLGFQETITVSGGGPVYGFLQPINGPPIRQKLLQQTPYQAKQSGSATSLVSWLMAPRPIWPQHLLHAADTTRTGPQPGPRGLVYAVSWDYEFGSATPLTANPTAWVGSG